MENTNKKMFKALSDYVSNSDVYAARATAKISMSIFKHRKEMKMTQKQFAEMMGVSQGMVSKWESAEYNFTIETLSQIAEKLHMVFEIDLKPESEYLKNIDKSNYVISKQSVNWQGLPAFAFSAA